MIALGAYHPLVPLYSRVLLQPSLYAPRAGKADGACIFARLPLVIDIKRQDAYMCGFSVMFNHPQYPLYSHI